MMPYLGQVCNALVWLGMALIPCYHLLTGGVFLNTADRAATGLELWGNAALTPFQYLFDGAWVECQDGLHYRRLTHFDYREGFWVKTCASLAALPFSLIAGTALKGGAYLLSPEVRARHAQIALSLSSPELLASQLPCYAAMGIDTRDYREGPALLPLGYERRPGDEENLAVEKRALAAIVEILSREQVLFWIDCGSCLGAYRYGGVIPWDHDIDIAILQPDFDNVWHLLQQLDPDLYVVQDWSGRARPRSYLKVYVKETRALIDIYHFAVDPERRTVASILANEENVFLPESWKIRERRFTMPTPFDMIFPLQKALFDGLEVPVPRETRAYLEMRYGKDLSPIRLYDPATGTYEKDLSHPYWQLPYVY
jgi:hypothetical protein